MASAMTKEPVKSGLGEEVLKLIETIGLFGDLLTRETDALSDADFKAVDALQQEKRVMARQYAGQVQAISSRKDEFAALDIALREKFIRARTAFTILLNDNLRALDRTRDSAKRMSDRILSIARQTAVEERQTHYSSRGQAAASKGATMSLTVDENL